VVPVGLTRHRERLPALRAVTGEEAGALVRTIEGWQRELQRRLGTRFVWAADELYLQAGVPLPPARAYEGFPVVEDGIGLVRRFEDAWTRALSRRPRRPTRLRRVTVVTGEMFAPRMRALLDPLAVDGLTVCPVAVTNELFGRGIGVAGLLTGRDIQIQLEQRRAAGHELGDEVLVPAVALRDGAGVFLDDLTPSDLAASLGIPVTAVEPDAPAFLAALIGR
jgi:NifB/MoaA-like Fe-S oxidoreductase